MFGVSKAVVQCHILQSIEGIASQVELPPGWQSLAAWANLANGNYEGAVSLWTSLDDLAQQQVQPLLVPLAVNGPSISWTPSQSQLLASAIGRVGVAAARIQFDLGLTHLEAGQFKQAAICFRNVVQLDPTSGSRRLAEFYYFLLTEKRLEAPLPLDRIPLDPRDMFAPEEATMPAETDKPQDK